MGSRITARGSGDSRVLLLAPVIFFCHFLEEAPGFVAWFNAHVPRGISQALFWRVNVTALAITVAVVAAERAARSGLTAAAVAAWLSFLMAANALFHIAGALADGAYMPGLVTALLLYAPFYTWVVRHFVRNMRLRAGVLAATAVAGALPMLIHGYLIVFRGSRLF